MAYESKPWVGTLPEGSFRLCTCGESANKPHCDGSHARTGSDKRPALYVSEKEAQVAVCQCGRTANSPLCDGSHSR